MSKYEPFYVILTGEIEKSKRGRAFKIDGSGYSNNLRDEDAVTALLQMVTGIVRESDEEIDIGEVLKVIKGDRD